MVIKYPEDSGKPDRLNPWSIRQTGVYQSYDDNNNTSLWIVVNPNNNSASDRRIRTMLDQNNENLSILQEHPPLLGLVVLEASSTNWRSYMWFLEKEQLNMV